MPSWSWSWSWVQQNGIDAPAPYAPLGDAGRRWMRLMLGGGVTGTAIKRLIIRLKDGTRVMADISFTRDAAQFPTLLLIRTGSARHNAYLSGLARDQGMQLGSDGLKRGDQRIACVTEADIFAELGLGYREPPMREDDEDD